MSKVGSFEASLDALVCAILTQDGRVGGLTVGQLRHEVQTTFGASLPEPLILEALQRSARRHDIIHIRATDTYAAEPSTRQRIGADLSEARTLESEVRREWLASLRPPIEDTSIAGTELWAMLLDYSARAFRRHGAEMQMLINPDPKASLPGSSLLALLRAAIDHNCHSVDHEVATRAAFEFFNSATPERTRYVTSLLDATFTVYALGADVGLAKYLRGLTQPISLFVDTNFIFAILGLHENALVEVSKQLVDLVAEASLPIQLIVHRDTMREFQYLVSFARQSLKGRRWTHAVSAALLNTDELSAIERRFHEVNARQPSDVDAFFLQFSEAVVLNALHARMYRRKQPRDERELAELRTLESEYADFIKTRGVDRSSHAIAHDASVLMDVARLQRRGSTVMAVRALFLTTDYRLFDFDWTRFRAPGMVGTAILPSQFLQLIRPFIPVNEDFDSRFVKTFAMPEVRIISADHSRAVAMLSHLLTALPGIDEPLAVRVVTDDALVGRLSALIEQPDAFAKAVMDTIALENKALIIERDVARDEVRRVAAELDEARNREAELREAIERASEPMSSDMGTSESTDLGDAQSGRLLQNPWLSGSYYLVVLLVLIGLTAFVAWLFMGAGIPALGAVAIAMAILLACAGGLIVIGSLQQTQDRTISPEDAVRRIELGLRAIKDAISPSGPKR